MKTTHQEKWLSQWGQKFGRKTADDLQNFLENCPQVISHSLACEPLLLYLIGRLHREGQLSQTLFNAESQDHLGMMQIYDQAINWVLARQRQDENIRLAGLGVEDLRNVLREAAICVVQSGGETAKLNMLEARLTDQENPISNLFKQARISIAQDTQKTLNNLLTTFYLKPHEGDKTGSIEFAHKSFEEFLFAERLYTACEDWTCLDRKNKHLDVSDQQMDWQLYDLLGYGALTPEIIKYLQVWLCKNHEFNLARLFTRLERFYFNWTEGGYIDHNPERNLPQRKMLQLQTLETVLGLRRIDINTGLNVMLLLFEIHAYGQSLSKRHPLRQQLNFQPCGDLKQQGFDKEKLKRVIAYSSLINRHEFIERVGFALRMASLSQIDLNDSCLIKANLQQANLANTHLNNADLRGSNLSGANLSRAKLAFAKLVKANLSGANLSKADLYNAQLFGVTLTQGNLTQAKMAGAKLINANLCSAQLRGAKLAEADLSKATLTGADLSHADLYRVNFYQADLENANLENANLFRANLSKANLKGIRWNKNTRFTHIKGWENAQNIPLQIQKMFMKAAQEDLSVQQSVSAVTV